MDGQVQPPGLAMVGRRALESRAAGRASGVVVHAVVELVVVRGLAAL